MKKFSLVLLCVATLAMIGCKKESQNEPTPTPDPEPEFVSPISVTDGVITDWDALTPAYVANAQAGVSAAYPALLGMKAYSDELYLNLLLEVDPAEIADHTSVPCHIYIDVDGSAATGGYGDQWTSASVDFMLEGFFYAEDQLCSYDGAGFAWTGEVGGTGWEWAETTLTGGASKSQKVEVGSKTYFEVQILRELLPTTPLAFADTYKVGVDIQQSWESVGILPIADDDPGTGSTVHVELLSVTTEHTEL